VFLVRDWYNPQDHSFGLEGGCNYLAKVLKVSDYNFQVDYKEDFTVNGDHL